MTLYNKFWLKRGVGLFSRVGLLSGDYGIYYMKRKPHAYLELQKFCSKGYIQLLS